MAGGGGAARALKWLLPPLLLAGALFLALQQAWIRIPANWLPWGEVRLEEPPTWLSRFQINGLMADPAACLLTLDRSKLEYRKLAERPLKNGCGLSNGVRIVKSQIAYSSGFDTTCAMTAALYWYERELNALAQARFGSKVARIDHLGSYSCRTIAGSSRLSQHALANALDIAGFQLADGTGISVLRDWGKDTPKGRFLADAHAQACGFFNTVLGPDYNAAHANHFHLDLGRARICR